LLLALSFVLTAVIGSVGTAQDEDETSLVLISAAGGPATVVMENGARQAAEDLGVSLVVRSAGLGSSVADAIDAAVATRPDGIAVAVEAIDDLPLASVDAAAASRVPVIAVGPLDDAATPPGVLLRIGPDEVPAGTEAGERLGGLGVTKALCLRVATRRPDADRCTGAAAGVAETGGSMEVLLALDPAGDPSGIRGAVAARLLGDPTIDGVLLTDAASTSQVVAAIADAGRDSTVELATIGIGADALDAIEAGEMAFAVDQRPFRQGYLAVLAMTAYARDGLVLGNGEPLPVTCAVVTPAGASARCGDEP